MDPNRGNAVIPSYMTTRSTVVINQCLQKPAQRPNAYDACLNSDRMLWNVMVASGGLRKICCPRGRTPYTTRPWIAMPAEGRRFKPIGILAVPNAAGFNGLDTQVKFNTQSGNELVPVGYNGVITDIVCGIEAGTGGSGAGFVEGSGDLTWRLSASGRFLRDHGNVLTSLGSLTSPSPVPRGGIRVWSEDILQFFVAFAPGADARINATSRIVVSITGWFYPR